MYTEIDLSVPKFLRRVPGDVKPAPRGPRKDWTETGSAKVTAEISKKRIAREEAKATVRMAVKEGADTFGKIRKAVDLEDNLIKSALKFNIRRRFIFKSGRRYSV